MTNRRILISIVFLCTLALLLAGLILPMMTIKLDSFIDAGIAKFDSEVINSTRSILGTCKDLFSKDRYIVSFLIFLFSVIIPFIKTIMFLVLEFGKDKLVRRCRRVLSLISKWSMADVFVVAIFLTYLATSGYGEIHQKSLNIFGMSLNLKVRAVMEASLEPGFYFFLAYCLVSMISSQLLVKDINNS